MIPENTPPRRYWYSTYEGYEVRCQRRLQVDLGVDETTAEVLLRLRRQILELQAQIRSLEAGLIEQGANQHSRLAHYRQETCEAAWIELEIQE